MKQFALILLFPNFNNLIQYCAKVFHRSVSTYCTPVFVICLCLFFVCINVVERRAAATPASNSNHAYITISRFNHHFVNKSNIPFCSKNLLDLRQYDFTRWAKNPEGSNLIMSSSNGDVCQLAHYTASRVVNCIDSLQEKFIQRAKKPMQKGKALHFAFIGDSRIRQQYLNVLKLIPAYDWKHSTSVPMYHFQVDRTITSKLLNLRLSFYWRPLVNDTVINLIKQWSNLQTDPPFLLVIGIAAHHMLQINGADYSLYQRKLAKLGPTLGQLSRISRVIWLNQYPTFDFYAHILAHNTDIFAEKIQMYNKVIRHAVRDYPEVRIWDSSNPLAEEYIRSCKLAKRKDVNKFTSYTNCGDYIHTGFVALSSATQLLMNDICNYESFYN